MKKFFIFLIPFLILLIAFGCAKSGPSPSDTQLKEIATKEKAWLTQLQPISERIRADVEQWENGKITREQLTEKLSAEKPKVKELRDQSDQYYLSLKLSDEIKKSPDYNKGLYYGQSLRLNVYSFLTDTTSAKQLTDKELKDTYQNEMVDSYNRKIGLLQQAIEKFTE